MGINLIQNGDFEQWESSGPIGWQRGGASFRETADKYQGRASLKLTGDWLSQNIATGAGFGIGRTYRVSFWYKGTNPQFYMGMTIHSVAHYLQGNMTWRADVDPDFYGYYLITAPQANWTYFTITFQPDIYGGSAPQLIFQGNILVDCVIVEDVTRNLLADGGFEDWADSIHLSQWYEEVAGTSSVNREASDKKAGAYSMRADVDSSNHQAAVSQNMTLKPGGNYRLSFWYKAAPTKQIIVYLVNQSWTLGLNSDGSWALNGSLRLTGDGAWHFYSISMKMPASDAQYVIDFAALDCASSSYFIDAACVEEINAITFADLASKPIAGKDFLVRLQPREWHPGWSKTAGFTNVYDVAWHDLFDLSGADQGEKLEDAGLELWSSPNTLIHWAKYEGGTSTLNRDTAGKHGGSYCARFDIDASGNAAYIDGHVHLIAGKRYRVRFWANSPTGKVFYSAFGIIDLNIWLRDYGAWQNTFCVWKQGDTGGVWQESFLDFVAPLTDDYLFQISKGGSAVSYSFYVDDASVEGRGDPASGGSLFRRLDGVSENGTPYTLETESAPSFGYFGQNNNGTTHASRSADYIHACAFANDVGNGVLTEIGINLYAGATGKVRLGIYADSGGVPGALLLDAGEITNPIAGWNSITGLSLAVTSGTTYWIAWLNDVAMDVYHDAGYSYRARTFTYAPLPDPCGTTSETAGRRTSVRAGVQVPAGDSLSAVDSTPGSYYYDAAAKKLYVHALSSGDPNSPSKYITSIFSIFTASGIKDDGRGIIFDGIFYEPVFDSASIPAIEAEQVDFLSGGGLAVSDATLRFLNNRRFWDVIFERWIWKNAPAMIYFGGEDLPLSEYVLILAGKLVGEQWAEDRVEFECVDNLDLFKRNIPVNPLFGDNVIEADRGKPIPLCFGYIESIMPLCVDASDPDASVWQIADPAFQTLKDIIAVWDGTSDVTDHVTKDLANCKFTFNAYTPTGVVTCDVQGAKISDIPGESSDELMTNGADIIRFFLKKILKLQDAEIDLPSFAAARIEIADVQLAKYIRYRRNMTSYIEEIERSVFGNVHQTTDGKFGFDIFSPLYNEDDTIENWEWDQDFRQSSPLSKMYSGVKVLYRPLPIDRPEGSGEGEDDSYLVIEGLNARAQYVENQDAAFKQAVTWIVDPIFAQTLCDRIRFLTNVPNITIDASARGIKLFARRPGDVLKVSKTIAAGLNRTIANSYFQIIKIIKEFADDRTTLQLDNFKGAAFFVGSWTDDAASAWATASEDQKNIQGFWTDDNGFVDPADPTSKNRSLYW